LSSSVELLIKIEFKMKFKFKFLFSQTINIPKMLIWAII
jgi:hypothetical protein